MAVQGTRGPPLHPESCLLLNDGHRMPVIALGTFSPEIVTFDLIKKNLMPVSNVQSTELFDQAILKCAEEAVRTALDVGYRHVDSAYIYMTETAAGRAFQEKFSEGTIKREDVFYTTKVECHPYLSQNELLEFCTSHGIVLVAYGILGSPGLQGMNPNFPNPMKDPVLKEIGEKYRKSPEQVSIRYIIQRGIAAIIKSFNPNRIRHNFQVFDFTLSPEDMAAIDALNKNLRNWVSVIWKNHPQYPFGNETERGEKEEKVQMVGS